MFKLYNPLPCHFNEVKIGGVCPHCSEGSRFSLSAPVNIDFITAYKVNHFIAGYTCELCLGPIPIQWRVVEWTKPPKVNYPKNLLLAREPFDFEHVPDTVKVEVEEALSCLSVDAFNGFAALCRRVVQAICTDLGAKGSSKVKAQIEEMISLTNLSKDWRELALQIMLTGHDGSHPHLPEVGAERAAVLLTLLKDLVYQLYTRPGKVKEAAALRQQVISET